MDEAEALIRTALLKHGDIAQPLPIEWVPGEYVDSVVNEKNGGDSNGAARAERDGANVLQAELEMLKPSALKKRARAAGVPEVALDEADDAKSPKDELLMLVIVAETSVSNFTTATDAAVGMHS
eukprot:SAG11_NODE_1437_length_4909_cov_2.303742_1_plen_124_part_00